MLPFSHGDFIGRKRCSDATAGFHPAVPSLTDEMNFQLIFRMFFRIKISVIYLRNFHRLHHRIFSAPFGIIFQNKSYKIICLPRRSNIRHSNFRRAYSKHTFLYKTTTVPHDMSHPQLNDEDPKDFSDCLLQLV